MAARELLLLRRIVNEIHKLSLVTAPLDSNFAHIKTGTLVASEIFEDNASCIVLAYSDSTKTHTKHLSLTWHHFRDYIQSGHIKVTKVDTHYNWADIMTKPLCKVKHINLCRMITGW